MASWVPGGLRRLCNLSRYAKSSINSNLGHCVSGSSLASAERSSFHATLQRKQRDEIVGVISRKPSTDINLVKHLLRNGGHIHVQAEWRHPGRRLYCTADALNA